MIKLDKITREAIEKNQGKYIIVEGHGYINGLAEINKPNTYKILGFDETRNVMLVKGYRQKNRSVMPSAYFNQKAVIFNDQEYKKLPHKLDEYIKLS